MRAFCFLILLVAHAAANPCDPKCDPKAKAKASVAATCDPQQGVLSRTVHAAPAVVHVEGSCSSARATRITTAPASVAGRAAPSTTCVIAIDGSQCAPAIAPVQSTVSVLRPARVESACSAAPSVAGVGSCTAGGGCSASTSPSAHGVAVARPANGVVQPVEVVAQSSSLSDLARVVRTSRNGQQTSQKHVEHVREQSDEQADEQADQEAEAREAYEEAREAEREAAEEARDAQREALEEAREAQREAAEEAREAAEEAREEALEAAEEAREAARDAAEDVREAMREAQSAQSRAQVEIHESLEAARAAHPGLFDELGNLDVLSSEEWKSAQEALAQADFGFQFDDDAFQVFHTDGQAAKTSQSGDLEDRIRALEKLTGKAKTEGKKSAQGSLEERVAALERALAGKGNGKWTARAPRALTTEEANKRGLDASMYSKKALEKALERSGPGARGFRLENGQLREFALPRGAPMPGVPTPPAPPERPGRARFFAPAAPATPRSPDERGTSADQRRALEDSLRTLREEAESLRAEMSRMREAIDAMPRNGGAR